MARFILCEIPPNILREIFNLGLSDRVLLTSPLSFDPSIVDIFMTLTRGARLVIVPREVKRRPDLLLEVIVQTRLTYMQVQHWLSFTSVFENEPRR